MGIVKANENGKESSSRTLAMSYVNSNVQEPLSRAYQSNLSNYKQAIIAPLINIKARSSLGQDGGAIILSDNSSALFDERATGYPNPKMYD